MLSRDEYQEVAVGIVNARSRVVDGVAYVPLDLALRIVAAATEPQPLPRINVIPIKAGEAQIELSLEWPA